MHKIRRLILWAAYLTGLLELWRFWHRYDIVILMAHGVTDEEEALSWKPLRPQLSVSQLEKYLRILARRYRFITLDEAVDMIRGRRPLQKYCLVFTFDDGYRNNVTQALPVLRRYGAPATIFLATGHVEEQRPFWFDRLDYVLQRACTKPRDIGIDDEIITFHGADRDALRRSYSRLRSVAKRMKDDGEMRAALDAIASALESESGRSLQGEAKADDWAAVLTWDEIRKAQGEVGFGSHTVDHVRLALVPPEVARDQLIRSKEAMESHTDMPCRHFCYPSGNFSPAVMELVRECGYESAVTTQEGTNRIGDDVFALRRVNLPCECDVPELLTRVSGLSARLAGI